MQPGRAAALAQVSLATSRASRVWWKIKKWVQGVDQGDSEVQEPIAATASAVLAAASSRL